MVVMATLDVAAVCLHHSLDTAAEVLACLHHFVWSEDVLPFLKSNMQIIQDVLGGDVFFLRCSGELSEEIGQGLLDSIDVSLSLLLVLFWITSLFSALVEDTGGDVKFSSTIPYEWTAVSG